MEMIVNPSAREVALIFLWIVTVTAAYSLARIATHHYLQEKMRAAELKAAINAEREMDSDFTEHTEHVEDVTESAVVGVIEQVADDDAIDTHLTDLERSQDRLLSDLAARQEETERSVSLAERASEVAVDHATAGNEQLAVLARIHHGSDNGATLTADLNVVVSSIGDVCDEEAQIIEVASGDTRLLHAKYCKKID